MKLIKISCEQESDTFITVDSTDLQDCMYAIERYCNDRNSKSSRGENPRIVQELLFSLYGDCTFQGYAIDEQVITFKAEIVSCITWDHESFKWSNETNN